VADGQPSPQAARRAELAAFLRAQRALLQPADVGLREYGERSQRRTPGLRREEIAELAGVSLTWYTWLEQGRDVTASEQVIDALARALRLDSDHHRHLRGLAGLTSAAPSTPVAEVLPRLQRLVDTATPSPASVYDRYFDYVVWNEPYARLRHDPAALPAARRNLLWYMFADAGCRTRMTNWEPAARAVLSQYRAAVGQRPAEPPFTTMVAELTELSPEFQRWWSEYPIRYFRPATITVDHPEVGQVDLEMFQLRPVEYPDLLMVVQVPVSGADRHRVAALLDGPPGSVAPAPPTHAAPTP
jgi:transcriptional regulator with XRE-family HTH domain